MKIYNEPISMIFAAYKLEILYKLKELNYIYLINFQKKLQILKLRLIIV